MGKVIAVLIIVATLLVGCGTTSSKENTIKDKYYDIVGEINDATTKYDPTDKEFIRILQEEEVKLADLSRELGNPSDEAGKLLKEMIDTTRDVFLNDANYLNSGGTDMTAKANYDKAVEKLSELGSKFEALVGTE
jgi:hypothetical protein